MVFVKILKVCIKTFEKQYLLQMKCSINVSYFYYASVFYVCVCVHVHFIA